MSPWVQEPYMVISLLTLSCTHLHKNILATSQCNASKWNEQVSLKNFNVPFKFHQFKTKVVQTVKSQHYSNFSYVYYTFQFPSCCCVGNVELSTATSPFINHQPRTVPGWTQIPPVKCAYTWLYLRELLRSAWEIGLYTRVTVEEQQFY